MDNSIVLFLIYGVFVGLAWYSTTAFEILKELEGKNWASFVFVLPATAEAVMYWGVGGLLVGLLGVGLIYILASVTANKNGAGNEQHIRGAQLLDATDADVLKRKKNENEKNYNRVFSTIGGVCIAQKNEARGFLMLGSPGCGKSQAFNELIESVFARKERAIIFDESGDYVKKHYRESDLMFSIGDRRSVGWSVMNEIKRKEDYGTVARSLIPVGKGTQQAEWNSYARSVLQVILEKVFEKGGKKNSIIYEIAMFEGVDKLKELVKRTVAQRSFEDGNERMLGSIMTVLTFNLEALSIVPDGDFSIRDYVENENSEQYLYLVTDSNRIKSSASAYRAMLSLAITYANSLETDENRRLWFFLDELPALESLNNLDEVLNRGRKKGSTVVVGLQSINYLDELYGKDKTPLLMNGFGTVLIMRSVDEMSAKSAAAQLGTHDVVRAVTSESSGTSGAGSSSNKSVNYQVAQDVKLVTGSELTNLPDLVGYLRRSGGDYPVLLVRIPICEKHSGHKPFIPALTEAEQSHIDEIEFNRIKELEELESEREDAELAAKQLEEEIAAALEKGVPRRPSFEPIVKALDIQNPANGNSFLDSNLSDLLNMEASYQRQQVVGGTVRYHQHNEEHYHHNDSQNFDHSIGLEHGLNDSENDGKGSTFTGNPDADR